MSALPIVADWRRTVAGLLPQRHRHQAHALADLSFAAALAGDCRANRISPHVPTGARTASSRRRLERLLGNPRLRPRQARRELARSPLAHWAGATVLLILDEAPHANDLRAMCVRVADARRALPVAWVCYRPDAPPQPLPRLVCSLSRQVRGCVPGGCEVVLLADRGWPGRCWSTSATRAAGATSCGSSATSRSGSRAGKSGRPTGRAPGARVVRRGAGHAGGGVARGGRGGALGARDEGAVGAAG